MSEPSSPVMNPSSTNGQRTNQRVAPTSCMISISRRREKIDSRTVVEISRMAARPNSAVIAHMPFSTRLIVPSMLRTVFWAYLTPSVVPGVLSTAGSLKNWLAISSTLLGSLR